MIDATPPGWLACRRRPGEHHHPRFKFCDCLRNIGKRAVTYARRYPGQSATQIAHALRAKPTTVSAALYRAVQAGELMRSNPVVGADHWAPKQGGGPRGGHVYGPVPPDYVPERKRVMP
jgi:hypothetical protein